MAKTCFETNCKNLKVERMWDGAVVTNGRCYTEYGVSVDSKENDIKTMETCHNLGCFWWAASMIIIEYQTPWISQLCYITIFLAGRWSAKPSSLLLRWYRQVQQSWERPCQWCISFTFNQFSGSCTSIEIKHTSKTERVGWIIWYSPDKYLVESLTVVKVPQLYFTSSRNRHVTCNTDKLLSMNCLCT